MIDTSELDQKAQPEALELREALVAYKQSSGRMFPTCSEVLEVIRELGYEQPAAELESSTETIEVAVETEPVAI